jgi:hypothetical protein
MLLVALAHVDSRDLGVLSDRVILEFVIIVCLQEAWSNLS